MSLHIFYETVSLIFKLSYSKNSNASKSSDSFQSCHTDERRVANDEGVSPSSGQRDSDDTSSDNDSDENAAVNILDSDDDSDQSGDDDQAAHPAEESTTAPPERPAVLSKTETKPSFNFIRDYLACSQFSMKPIEFKSRRRSDLGFVQRFNLSHKLEGHTGCVNAM